MDPLVIDLPAFTAQELIEPTAAVSNPHPGQFFKPHHKSRCVFGPALVIPAGPIESHQPAGAAGTDLKSLAEPCRKLPLSCGLQNFFASTSWSIC